MLFGPCCTDCGSLYNEFWGPWLVLTVGTTQGTIPAQNYPAGLLWQWSGALKLEPGSPPGPGFPSVWTEFRSALRPRAGRSLLGDLLLLLLLGRLLLLAEGSLALGALEDLGGSDFYNNHISALCPLCQKYMKQGLRESTKKGTTNQRQKSTWMQSYIKSTLSSITILGFYET